MPANDYYWLILVRLLAPSEIRKDWGYVQAACDALFAQMIEGDEVWEFETSDVLENPFHGQSGLALKRGSQIIGHVTTGRILR